MEIMINRAKVHRLLSNLFCLLFVMATVNFAGCEEKQKSETTTVSGNVYLSDGNALQGVNVEVRILNYDNEKINSYILSAKTNSEGYFEVKTEKQVVQCQIIIQQGETMNGKRWKYYTQMIENIISGESNTVNIYLQLY